MLTVQYTSPEERESLIQSHAHLFLVEEKNISEGNFLVFSDTPYIKVPMTSIEQRVATLEDTMNFMLLGGM